MTPCMTSALEANLIILCALHFNLEMPPNYIQR